VEVVSKPDPPSEFSLDTPISTTLDVWPDTILFRWYASTDPDSGDAVYYVWMLSSQGGPHGSINRTTTQSDTVYHFIPDTSLADGVYFWWVTAWDLSARSRDSEDTGVLIVGDVSGVEEEQAVLPEIFGLSQNYPNPFNPETRISYQLPEPSSVRLLIFDPLGRRIRLLADESKRAGIHTAIWDATDDGGRSVTSGIYICRLEAGNRVFYRKMMLIR